MLTELDKAFEFLQEMKRRHQFVSQRTGALHQACEQLVEEEVCACIHLSITHTRRFILALVVVVCLSYCCRCAPTFVDSCLVIVLYHADQTGQCC